MSRSCLGAPPRARTEKGAAFIASRHMIRAQRTGVYRPTPPRSPARLAHGPCRRFFVLAGTPTERTPHGPQRGRYAVRPARDVRWDAGDGRQSVVRGGAQVQLHGAPEEGPVQRKTLRLRLSGKALSFTWALRMVDSALLIILSIMMKNRRLAIS